MTETTSLPSRIAELEADSTTIHGVAISAGEVTKGLEGVRKVWPADELRKAAESLEGVPVTVLHSEQDAGEVVRAGYDADRDAVVYEAELTDEKLADQVRAGQADVSIEARHKDGGEDPETDAMKVESIRFQALSIVQEGASPSNSADAGPAPAEALAAELSAAEIRATLADDSDSDVETLQQRLAEKDDRIEALEAELEEVADVKRAYAAALADRGSLMDEDDLVEKFTLAELREKFDGLDARIADPTPEPDVQSGAGAGGKQAARLSSEGKAVLEELDTDDRDEAVATLRQEYDQFKSVGWESNAENVAEKLAKLGVDVPSDDGGGR